MGGINTELLNSHLGEYFAAKKETLLGYINKLIKVSKNLLDNGKSKRAAKVL